MKTWASQLGSHLLNSSYLLILNKDVLCYSEEQFLQGNYPKSDQNILDQGQQILDKDQIQPSVKLHWKTVMSADLHSLWLRACMHAKLHQLVSDFATPRTVARQAPLSIGFSRQQYWSGLPCPPPGDLPDPGIKPVSLTSPVLAGGFFTTSTTWEATMSYTLLVLKSPNYILGQAASCPFCRWVNSISEWVSCHRKSQARKWTVTPQSSSWPPEPPTLPRPATATASLQGPDEVSVPQSPELGLLLNGLKLVLKWYICLFFFFSGLITRSHVLKART